MPLFALPFWLARGLHLAMIAAYVLAGELGRTAGRPQEAFERYEHRLHLFIAGKQKAAMQFGDPLPRRRD